MVEEHWDAESEEESREERSVAEAVSADWVGGFRHFALSQVGSHVDYLAVQ